MRNIERLKTAFYELTSHRSAMNRLKQSVREPFGIRKGVPTKDNLWRIMLLDVQSRAGAALGVEKVEELHRQFLRDINLAMALPSTNQDKFEALYKAILGLRGIGPKIASVFLRQVVCEYRILPELKPYLFLPVDRHIETILTKRLEVVDECEISKGNPLTCRQAREFQRSLSELPWLRGRWRRVDLDAFWFVGYLFCSKNSGTVCSDICWIRRFCRQKNG